jgi:hypothetical protein
LFFGIAATLVASTLGLYVYQSTRPRRVWVEYSEKYQDKNPMRTEDYERVDKENQLFAEERLGRLIASNKDCIILTRDKQKADLLVSISVIRYIGGGDTFGEAKLSITKHNGDVLLTDTFYQDRNSAEDIARQPISKV